MASINDIIYFFKFKTSNSLVEQFYCHSRVWYVMPILFGHTLLGLELHKPIMAFTSTAVHAKLALQHFCAAQ